MEDDLGAGALGEHAQRQPVGLVDPARLRRRAHLEQLGTGGEHVHDGAPVHGHGADAGRCERGDVLDPELGPGGREHVPAGDVLAAVAHVRPGRERTGRRDPVAVDARVLDAQDRVGARRAAPRPW